MSSIANLVTGAFDSAFKQQLEKSQHYQDTKAGLKADAEHVRTVAEVAACIGMGSITLAVLGMGFCAARREGVGGDMICCAVPLTILSYNCYQVSENFLTQVEEDPTQLMVLDRMNEPIPVNTVALKKCLLHKTLFFEPFTNFYIRHNITSVKLD